MGVLDSAGASCYQGATLPRTACAFTPADWTVRDRYNNEVYLTYERWEHVTDLINHPEMAAYEEHLQDTIRSGQRRQDP